MIDHPEDRDRTEDIDLGMNASDTDLELLLRRALANHTRRDGYLLALIHGRGDRRRGVDREHPDQPAVAREREPGERRRPLPVVVTAHPHQFHLVGHLPEVRQDLPVPLPEPAVERVEHVTVHD